MVSNGIMESHAETIAMVMVPGSAELSELAASVAASLVSVPAAAGAAVVAVCDAELPQPASADVTFFHVFPPFRKMSSQRGHKTI